MVQPPVGGEVPEVDVWVQGVDGAPGYDVTLPWMIFSPGYDVGPPHHCSVCHVGHLICSPEHPLIWDVCALVVVAKHLVLGATLLETGRVSAPRWREASPSHQGEAPIFLSGQVYAVVSRVQVLLLARGQRCCSVNRNWLGLSILTEG